MNTMVIALALFIVMYVLLLVFSEQRWIIALAAAAIFMAIGILSPAQAFRAIN